MPASSTTAQAVQPSLTSKPRHCYRAQTRSGLDKKALPEVHSKSLERAYVAPASDLEHSFCQLFEQTLSLEKVGATDNFFEIFTDMR